MKITVDREKREATVDFTGTSPVQKTNFNAPEPVTRAAVLYAFRVMVEDDIPMNAGCLRPINIVIPEGSMLPPRLSGRRRRRQCRDLAARHQRAVRRARRARLRAGHDEQPHLRQRDATSTTRRSARARRPAGSTTARGFDGTVGVHTHMTNSRLTDPEILELRFPVLLEDFHIREGSGGKGKWNAGDGTRRTHPLPRGDGLRHPLLAPQPPAARPRRRRRRRARQDRGPPRRRHDRDAAGLRPDRARSPARR